MNSAIVKNIYRNLLRLGIAPGTTGYYYLLDSIGNYMAISGDEKNRLKTALSVTADKYHTDVNRLVSSGTRAISGGWQNRDAGLSCEIFDNGGYETGSQPTCEQLILSISDWIKNNRNC